MVVHSAEYLNDFVNSFHALPILRPGDKVAILSPSFAAPAVWPHVHELGCQRLREVFGLEPIEFPTTRKLGAPVEDKMRDLIQAFEDPSIKAVISTLGGDEQVTWVKKLPREPFMNNPKPFFGYSDNGQFMDFLWKCRIPSFYGGALFTEFAEQGEIHEFTVQYLKRAFFERGMVELTESPVFNDEGLTWSNPEMLTQSRRYQPNSGWNWDGNSCVEGVTWGGCYESIADMLMNGIPLPSVEEFAHIVLVLETSEEIPPADPVKRFVRALGERGILSLLQGIVVGRPKAWEFHIQNNDEQKETYKQAQAEGILSEVRKYNQEIPVVQNLDFGHTGPQIPLPLGKRMRIDSNKKSISVEF